MLEWLKDVKICPLDFDGVHIIGRHGGLIAQHLEPCFKEMRAWVRIVAQILSAEVPSFHLVSAFSIFSVDYLAGREQLAKLSNEEVVNNIAKIAHVCKIPLDEFTK